MRFEIIARVNTRSVSYSRTSILVALSAMKLTWEQKGQIIHTQVPQERVAELEYNLQLVDRGVVYRKVVES